MKTLLLSSSIMFILFWPSFITAEPRMVMTNALLPSARSNVGTFYDGDDSIYIFGGSDGTGGTYDEILKYSILEDKVELIARLNAPFHIDNRNAITINSEGTIHLFPGYQSCGVLEFNTSTLETRVVANFTRLCDSDKATPHAQISPDQLLLFGGRRFGHEYNLFQVDLISMELSEYKEDVYDGFYAVFEAFAFDEESRTIFSTFWNGSGTPYTVASYELGTENIKILMETPYHVNPSGAVWIDGKMYVVDGIQNEGGDKTLAVFDPAELTYDFISVQGVNFTDPGTMTGRGVEYVEKFGRIYLFGGYTNWHQTLHDEIWYIDMVPATGNLPGNILSWKPSYFLQYL